MNNSLICGNGMHGLFDWAKSQVMEDYFVNKKSFEIADEDGKISRNVYTEYEVYLMIEQIKNFNSGKNNTFDKANMRAIFKRSF